MDWNTLITLIAIGVMFFLMMRHDGGCCGGGHSRPQDKPKEISKTNVP
ncbi:MAG: hypothetical protein SFV81_06645 [Pirellulaceae bacterium]|nr:hypothetical protein [Pirellulaceae bacterium]